MPLGSERVELDDIERAEGYELDDEGRKRRRSRKGKERAGEREGEGGTETVFALGDDEDR